MANLLELSISDGNGNTVAILVPVSVVTLLIAGCIVGLIVYVRYVKIPHNYFKLFFLIQA